MYTTALSHNYESKLISNCECGLIRGFSPLTLTLTTPTFSVVLCVVMYMYDHTVSTLNKLISHKIRPISGLHLAFRKVVQVPKLLGRLNCLEKLKIMHS